MSRKVGAEFEFMCTTSVNTVVTAMAKHGLRVDFATKYSSHVVLAPNIDVKVEPDTVGRFGDLHTIPSLPLLRILGGRPPNFLEAKTRPFISIADWDSVVPALLISLQRQNVLIDRRAAYHVTVAVPELVEDIRQLTGIVDLVYHYQAIIFGLVAPHIRDTSMMTYPITPKMHQALMDARYDSTKTVNALKEHYRRAHGINVVRAINSTEPLVEFRWHESTLDVDETAAWRDLMLRLIEVGLKLTKTISGEPVKNTKSSLKAFFKVLGYRHPNKILYARHHMVPSPEERVQLAVAKHRAAGAVMLQGRDSTGKPVRWQPQTKIGMSTTNEGKPPTARPPSMFGKVASYWRATHSPDVPEQVYQDRLRSCTITGGYTWSPHSGAITKITTDKSTGVQFLTIGGHSAHVPKDEILSVKVGDIVTQGEIISHGIEHKPCPMLKKIDEGLFCNACGCGLKAAAELTRKLRHSQLVCPRTPPLFDLYEVTVSAKQ